MCFTIVGTAPARHKRGAPARARARHVHGSSKGGRGGGRLRGAPPLRELGTAGAALLLTLGAPPRRARLAPRAAAGGARTALAAAWGHGRCAAKGAARRPREPCCGPQPPSQRPSVVVHAALVGVRVVAYRGAQIRGGRARDIEPRDIIDASGVAQARGFPPPISRENPTQRHAQLLPTRASDQPAEPRQLPSTSVAQRPSPAHAPQNCSRGSLALVAACRAEAAAQ